FEYETNMLLSLKEFGIKLIEQPIETVYIEENQTSHFRPVRDSIRVYSLILKFIISSAVASALDHLIFFLVKLFFGKFFVPYSILVSMIIARVFSSVTNFVLNKKTVFNNSDGVAKTIVRYYILAVPMLLISCVGIDLVTDTLGITSAAITTIIKIVIETVLFILSFRLQREWVFSRKKK
ncbi:MAG: GtrA family protein, partial [Clostridia bacterium]|nr:GtrA family protein [Clostridia bacterium]